MYRINFSLYGILDPFELNNPGAVNAEAEEYPREFEAPYHQVINHRIQLKSTIILFGKDLDLDLAFENDDRAEFEPKNNDPKDPEKFIGLNSNTFNLRALYQILQSKVSAKIGFQSKLSTTKNNAAYAFVPNYSNSQFGIFSFADINFEPLILSAGIRWDIQKISTSRYMNFFTSEFDKDFNSISGAFGATYLLTHNLKLSANYSHGFRAPNISELKSAGFRPETQRFEYGESN